MRNFLYPLLALFSASVTLAAPSQPHIVFILADDLGWNQIGKRAGVSNLHNDHASDYYLTPQINRLAEMGMTFNRAYSSPNCAPTRAALHTGVAASRHGITSVFDRGGLGTAEVKLPNNEVELAASFQTLAETLKAAGYATGHFGKWHIGLYTGANALQNQGFDINVGGAGNEQSSPETVGNGGTEYHADANGQWLNQGGILLPKVENGSTTTWTRTQGEHLSDALTAEAHTWMDAQVTANPDTPVFLYLPHHATHSPIDPKASDESAIPASSSDPRHDRQNFGGLLYGMDRSVGDLLDYLENNNDDQGNPLIDNTVFIFMADNGGEDISLNGRMSPLRGAKGSQFEGGVRVPLFISTPAMRTAGQANTATDQAVHVQDFHATLAALAGTTAPAGLDGVDFSQVLTDPANTFSRDIFEWWLQQPNSQDGEANATLQRGNLKLIWYPFEAFNPELTARFDLFNVVNDLSETTDLSNDPAYEATLLQMANDIGDKLETDGADLPYDANTLLEVPLPNTFYAYGESAQVGHSSAVAIDVLANDWDPNSEIDPTTVQIVGAATEGSTSVNPTTGVITYTHSGNNLNADSFTYTFDSTGAETSNEATVSISVQVGWDGETSNDLGVSTNWSPDTTPSATTDFLVDNNNGFTGANADTLSLTTGNTNFRDLEISAVGTNGDLRITSGSSFGRFLMSGDLIFSGSSLTGVINLDEASSSLSWAAIGGDRSILNHTTATVVFGGTATFDFMGWLNSSRQLTFGGTGDFILGPNTTFRSGTGVAASRLTLVGTAPGYGGTVTLQDGMTFTTGGGAGLRNDGGVIKIQGTDTIAADEAVGFGTNVSINEIREIDVRGLDQTTNSLTQLASFADVGSNRLTVDADTALEFTDLRIPTGNVPIDLQGWVESQSSLVFTDLGGNFYNGTVAEGEAFIGLTINGAPAYIAQVPDQNADLADDWAVRLAFPIVGTFALSGDDLIGDSTPLLLKGGSLQLAGFSDTAGLLYLEASSSIDVSGGGDFNFADSSALNWSGTLNITGTLLPRSLRFGSDANGLTPTQLAAIQFPNGGTAALDSEGYLEIAITAPNDLNGALVWLDAQDAGSLTESGGQVSVWGNKVNGANNAVQASGSLQPALNATGINSLPAIEFDGSDDRLVFQSAVDSTPGEFHVFALTFGPEVGTNNFQRILDTDSATDSYEWEILRPADGRTEKTFAPVALSQYSTANKTVETFTLGAATNGFNRFKGFLGEVVLYDRILSELERAAVFDYLNPRWSIAATDPNYAVAATPTLRNLGNATGIVMTGGVKDFYNYADQAAFLDVVSTNFGGWVPINDFKMGIWPLRPTQTTFDFTNADQHATEALARGMELRGHTLVWHNTLPGWLTGGSFTAAQKETIMYEHIDGMVGHFAGDVAIWDVVNEAFDVNGALRTNTPWIDIDTLPGGFAGSYIDKAFIRAAAADPDARLILNDFGAEAVNEKSDAMYAFVQGMLGRGVPIHGVGFQMHTDIFGMDYASMLTNFQRFSDLGLEIHITEMDVNIPEIATQEMLDQQAAVYRAVLEVATQVANFRSFSVWGVSDLNENNSNHPGFHKSLLTNESYQPKPAYEALRQELLEASDADADADGLWRAWEILTGTDPFDSASAAHPEPKIINQSGSDYLAIEFPFAAVSGLDLIVSGTDDLTNPLSWTDLDTTPGTGNAEASEAGGILTIRQTNPISSVDDFSFMRAETQQNP